MSKEFKDILQAKIDHYGETKFAYESACDEYIKSRTTHPSDSDICSVFNKIALRGEETEPKAHYITLHQAEESLIDMRDRMNGEMCLFMEWREENYTKTKKGYYHKGDFYKNDKPLTTEQLLQKFRSR